MRPSVALRMHQPGLVRSALTKGALVTAANWQVVLIQAVAEATFKLLLAVPILGAALIVVSLVGDSLVDLSEPDLRETLLLVARALADRPAALAGVLASISLVGLVGSVLVFLVKGGTVSILAEAERQASSGEPALGYWHAVRMAACFTGDRFIAGARRLFGRYLALGLLLVACYGASAAAYGVAVLSSLGPSEPPGSWIGWTVGAALLAVVLAIWTTVVNTVYVLMQIVIAVTDLGVRAAAAEVVRFLRRDLPQVAGIFAIVLMLIFTLAVLSLIGTAGLGLIAFVPLAGVAEIPIQLAAWLLRNVMFQYVGLSALTAYLSRYRACSNRQSAPLLPPGDEGAMSSGD